MIQKYPRQHTYLDEKVDDHFKIRCHLRFGKMVLIECLVALHSYILTNISKMIRTNQTLSALGTTTPGERQNIAAI